MDPVQPTTPAEDVVPVSAPSDAVANDSAGPAPESVIVPDEPAVEAPAAEPAAWPTAPAAPEAPSAEAPEASGSSEPTPGL